MIITRDTRPWACSADASILDALTQISEHKHGAVLCVEADGRLVGMLTDGDFRRWVVQQPDLDLRQPVRTIANPDPRTAPADTGPADLPRLLDDHIRFLPLVDERGHLVAVASCRRGDLRIGDRVSPTTSPPS